MCDIFEVSNCIRDKGDAFLGALGVDKMEEAPVVKMEGHIEVVDTEFECRD